MAGNLGSLVVHIGAETATLQSDIGRARTLFARGVADMQSQAAQFGKAVGAGLAAATTAVGAMVNQAINNADQLGKLSQKVGISTEALSGLKHQAGLADVELGALQTGLVRFNKTIAEAAAGGKQQSAAFQAMGISVKDLNGNLKPTQVLLGEVADRFSSYRDGAGKTAMAVQLLGRSGADLIPMLNEGAAGMKAAADEARAFGKEVSQGASESAQQFNDNLTKLKGAAEGFANQVAERLTPQLAGLSGKLVEGAKDGNGFAGAADGIATALEWAIKVSIIAKGAIEALVNMVAAGIDTLRAFGTMTAGAFESMQHQVSGLFKGAIGDFAGAREQFAQANQSMAVAAQDSTTKISAAWKSANTGIADAINNANSLVAAMDKPNKAMADFSKVVGGVGPVAKKAEAPTIDLGNATTKTGTAAAKAAKQVDTWSDSLRDAGAALDRLQAMGDQYAQDNADMIAKINGADDAQLAYNAALREANAEYQQILALGPPSAEAVAALGRASEEAGKKLNLTRQYEEQGRAMEAYREQVRKTQEMWSGFADVVLDAVGKSGSYLKNLYEGLKHWVLQMLREWAKTKIIGLFTGQGGGGWGAVAAGVAGAVGLGSSGSASAGGSGTEAATQAALSFATNGMTGGSGFSIMNPSSWTMAGKNLFDGFSASASANTTWAGTYTPDMGTGTWAPSTAGYVAAGVAGAYAGYNRWQGSNKDVGGALGGVAYGVGTYSLAVGASAAMAGGMAAGLAAIPVVGWIALAAMAVDMLSGGKLFGTKGKLHHSNLSMDVGAEGVALAQSYTLKGQKAFFGGTKWTTKGVTPSAEAMAAAQEFYAALTANREAFAKEFNAEVGSLIGGQWTAEFDKKGNLTKSSASVLGFDYKDATQEQFGQILVAENMIDVLSQFGEKLSALADPFRGNVEALTQFANAAATAQSAFMAGAEMLALGSQQSLDAFMELAIGLQAGSETIDQTVQRLLQAQAQYDQFVAQFAEPVTYVDDFQAALAGIQAQMQANMDQANALARAAGAEGAATDDLIRIHEYAAKQFAAALRQLEASAQDLAFNLGLTNVGSYDAISAEIERLQGKANQGADTIRDFGSAIQTAAQRASDAINLLLGDLSPLNDQEKLQKALEGLRGGTVTQEQVLQIGRRLYASSQAYNDLFAMVQGMGGRAASMGGGGRMGGGSSVGLTGAESKRLQELLKQQQEMQAAMQLQQYQTLAQQIAEASMAREIDWQAWVAERDISVQGLMEGLGLPSEADLDAYMDAIAEREDSNGANTQSIVDELQSIRRLLDLILNGRSGSGVDGGDRDGRYTEGRSRSRMISDEDAEAVGREVGRAIAGNAPRNSRVPVGAGSRGR